MQFLTNERSEPIQSTLVSSRPGLEQLGAFI